MIIKWPFYSANIKDKLKNGFILSKNHLVTVKIKDLAKGHGAIVAQMGKFSLNPAILRSCGELLPGAMAVQKQVLVCDFAPSRQFSKYVITSS